MPSDFLFATCAATSTAWLKADLREQAPELRLAFGRHGFVTFKGGATWPSERPLPSPFARCSGHSLGRASDLDQASALLDGLSLELGADPWHLQVLERRESELPADLSALGELALRVEAQWRAQFGERFVTARAALPGELVVVVLVAADSQPDQPWFVGWYRHATGRVSLARGGLPFPVPNESPSRAYAKVEEAIQCFDLAVRAGQQALEIGAAPGGAVLRLLERGLHVLAVDPAEIAPEVLARRGTGGTRATHLAKPAGEVTRGELPRSIDWLLSDVNLAPPVMLRYVERLRGLAGKPLRGVILTVKLNDDAMRRRVPQFLERVSNWGLGIAQAIQLPSHRQEVVIVAGERERVLPVALTSSAERAR